MEQRSWELQLGRRTRPCGCDERRPRCFERRRVLRGARHALRLDDVPPLGAEEAQTTFDGVTAGRSLAAETLLVDIGGGSTELVVGDPNGVSFTTSLQAGSVRQTERFLATDPPTRAELEAAAERFAASSLLL